MEQEKNTKRMDGNLRIKYDSTLYFIIIWLVFVADITRALIG